VPECAAVGVTIMEAEERVIAQDVRWIGTRNTLVRLTSTGCYRGEEASRNGDWQQFVVKGQFWAGREGTVGVRVLAVGDVLRFGSVGG
jgi:hypothetical protein